MFEWVVNDKRSRWMGRVAELTGNKDLDDDWDQRVLEFVINEKSSITEIYDQLGRESVNITD
jgi:hypothetical protein